MRSVVIFDMHQVIYCKTEPKLNRKSKAGQELFVKEMPGALDVFLDFYEQGYKIVIISSSLIQHSRDILKILLERRGLELEKIQQIFKEIDILTMQYFGTKYSDDSWKQAMSPYQNIEYIFEDGEEKLKAAGQAAQELGSDPELFHHVEEFLNELDEA